MPIKKNKNKKTIFFISRFEKNYNNEIKKNYNHYLLFVKVVDPFMQFLIFTKIILLIFKFKIPTFFISNLSMHPPISQMYPPNKFKQEVRENEEKMNYLAICFLK